MLFTELRFLLFFGVVFGLHWALRGATARKLLLLLASWGFYAAWDWRYLGLILVSTAVDHTAALAIEASRGEGAALARVRRRWLVTSLVANLGLLGVFKYYDFFAASGAELLGWLGLAVEPRLLELVLPVGISFYTFQTLSYTIDVYRGQLEARRRWLDVALFVAFFPQLVAGPIVRARDFLPQLELPRRLAAVPWRPLATLFLVGWVKKAVVSDQVAVVVDAVWADPGAHGPAALWLGALLYAVQIYCDFSGYSDMAIASAGLLGYTLPLNFDGPYLAGSITGFWRRWHISLSTWFRDYLYIPLGGNRRGPGRVVLNLTLVFLLCGLWHGAAWTFVLWGLWHGLFLGAERLAGLRDEGAAGPLRRVATLLVVLFGWVLFRSPDLAVAGQVAGGMLGLGAGASAGVPAADAVPAGAAVSSGWWLLLAVFAVGHVLLHRRDLETRVAAWPDWAWGLAYGAALGLLLPFAATGYQPFIYFQF